jgi:hypothetical protein
LVRAEVVFEVFADDMELLAGFDDIELCAGVDDISTRL